MNVVGAVREIILSDAATVALIASNAVYPVILPQTKTYPAITLLINDDRPEDYKWSPTAEKDRVELAIGIWAPTYDQAQKIDTAVRDAIDGFVGTVTTAADNVDHYIYDTAFLRRSDDYDQENKQFYRTVFYRVTYHRDIPSVPAGPPFTNNWQAQWQAAMNGLEEYDSTEAAVLDGYTVGMVYKSSSNHSSAPAGIPIQILSL